MSAQFAMMGMSVAGSIAGAALSATGARRSSNAQAASLQGQAAQLQLQSSQVAYQTEQKAKQIWNKVTNMMSTNAVSAAGKGIALDGGTSYDVIQQRVVEAGKEDIANTRLIGESQSQRLSFAATDRFMAASETYSQGNDAVLGAIIGGVTGSAKALGSYEGWGGKGEVDPRDIARGA